MTPHGATNCPVIFTRHILPNWSIGVIDLGFTPLRASRTPALSSSGCLLIIMYIRSATMHGAFPMAKLNETTAELPEMTSTLATLDAVVAQIHQHPSLPKDSWYLITAAVLCALNRPQEVASVFKYALDEDAEFNQRLLTARRYREVLLKVAPICGLPKVSAGPFSNSRDINSAADYCIPSSIKNRNPGRATR